MTTDDRSREELIDEVQQLRLRLEEAEETLQAIREGTIDALVVSTPEGQQVYTLEGADHTYRILVEAMKEGATTLAADGTILYCNGQMSRMLQVPLEKLIGTRFGKYVLGDDLPLFEERLRSCDAPDHDKDEVALLSADGTQLPVLFSCSPLEGSGTAGVSVVVTDISALKQAEQALRDEILERLRVTESLHEKEKLLILHSRQAAMGEMVSNIAHQWRQPLNSLGLTIQQLLLFYDAGKFTREVLSTSVANSMQLVQHMSGTIDDFRNFFKSDIDMTAFDLGEKIRQTLVLVGDSLKARHIATRIETASEGLTVQGYPNEFCQVLLNIIGNARDALEERQVESPVITIRAFRQGDACVTAVSDNAGGIPDDIIGRVFDPYFTTKSAEKGTGIGLYMSKAIVEKRMNGRISVRNTEQGAEFRIELTGC